MVQLSSAFQRDNEREQRIVIEMNLVELENLYMMPIGSIPDTTLELQEAMELFNSRAVEEYHLVNSGN